MLAIVQATDLAKARAARLARASKPGAVAADSSPAELARDLAAVVVHVFKTSGDDYLSLLAELDLTITQIKTLRLLGSRAGELSVKELSELLGLSLPTTSRNVEGLLQRGFVERREDEHDRRVRRVRATQLGREVSVRLDRTKMASMERFAASLSASERRRLRAALAPIMRREELGAVRPADDPGPAA
jgi:DNA-binding MarR family transcriptional regulator